MALEVSEIGISMRVRGDGGESTQTQAKAKGQKDDCGDDREELVADCVRRVLKILRNLEER